MAADGGKSVIPVSEDSFRAVTCIDGEGALTVGGERLDVRAGDSFFIPAGNKSIELSGEMTVAVTSV